ncbi:MAG: response regulator [Bacteroidota bacterium]
MNDTLEGNVSTAMWDHRLISLLLVDDEDSFRMVVKELLSSKGKYQVFTSDSGEDAIEQLQWRRVDLVLLDYKLSGMSGLNVLQWMHEQKMKTPVVMLTAAGSETVAVEAMKLGAYDYVRKDQIDKDHLPILLHGVYERYLLRREKEQREAIEWERFKNVEAIKAFHSTLTPILEIINSALLVVNRDIEEFERDLLPLVSKEGQVRLKGLFVRQRQEFIVLSSAAKSIVNMADVLRANVVDAHSLSQIRGTLEAYKNPLHEEIRNPGQRQS